MTQIIPQTFPLYGFRYFGPHAEDEFPTRPGRLSIVIGWYEDTEDGDLELTPILAPFTGEELETVPLENVYHRADYDPDNVQPFHLFATREEAEEAHRRAYRKWRQEREEARRPFDLAQPPEAAAG